MLRRLDRWFANLIFGRHEVPDLSYGALPGHIRRVSFLEWLLWMVIGWMIPVAILFRIGYEIYIRL